MIIYLSCLVCLNQSLLNSNELGWTQYFLAGREVYDGINVVAVLCVLRPPCYLNGGVRHTENARTQSDLYIPLI